MIKYFLLIFLLSLNLYGKEPFKLSILHTNDLHSYFKGVGPESLFTSVVNDKDIVKGHYARLSHLIKVQKQSRKNPVLLLDAGDFFGGTLFHLIAPDKNNNYAPELEFFIYNNYDLATIGNHEFDYGDDGFEQMLIKIKKSKSNFKILSSNIIFNSNGSWKSFYKDSIDGTGNSIVTNRVIKTFKHQGETIKVGMIGAMGPDAALVSRNNRKLSSFVGLNDKTMKNEPDSLNKLIQDEVNYLKKKKQVNIVILIIHAGEPEDEYIAKNVDGLDLIISGHTHQLYQTPKYINGTYLSQAGCYGQYLGVLDFIYHNGKLEISHNNKKTYIEVNDSIEVDEKFLKKINSYEEALEHILSKLKIDNNVAIYTSYKKLDKVSNKKELGKLVTSRVRDGLSKKINKKVDLYFTSASMIRTSINGSELGTSQYMSDIFKMLGLGVDRHRGPGYPISYFYLSKYEVRLLINFMEIYSKFSSNFTPAFSDDLSYEIRSWGVPMINRLKNLKWRDLDFSNWPEYMLVATNELISGYVDQVSSMSFGLVSFTPKNAYGEKQKDVFRTFEKEFVLFASEMSKRKELR